MSEGPKRPQVFQDGHRIHIQPLHIILSNKDLRKGRCVTFLRKTPRRGGRGGTRARQQPEQPRQGEPEASLYVRGSRLDNR